jgi:AraC-like DNA-binding protein
MTQNRIASHKNSQKTTKFQEIVYIRFQPLVNMSKSLFTGDFLAKAEAIVLENISNENFGVSELAEATNMSRSNLLRKIKKQTELSASQFIRNIRLNKGKELLTETEMTISEISYEVGFGNTSYFIKCFREEYGVPPGEIRKNTLETVEELSEDIPKIIEEAKPAQSFLGKHQNKILIGFSLLFITLIIIFLQNSPRTETAMRKGAKLKI